jgi:hypothetical protein
MRRLALLFALALIPICGCDIFVRPGTDVEVRERRAPDRDIDVDIDVRNRK